MQAKYKYLFILFVIFSVESKGQDPQFSQFYANSLYLAPSFAGATQDMRLSINYRNQWPAVPGVFHTYSVAFDKYMPNFNSGIGFLATHDVAGSGDLSTTNLGVLYSYDFNINKVWHVRPGVQFKFSYLGLNIYKLIWATQLNVGGTTPSIYPPPFENVADVDFGTSVMFYTEQIWAGIAVDHLLKPKVSFYGEDAFIPVKVDIFGGTQILARGRLRQKYEEVLSVAANLKFQGNFFQSDIGLYYYRNPIIFGMWYRGVPFVTSQAGDAVIGLIGFKTDQVHIGYSYDFTISNLIAATGGSHEISLIFEFTTFSVGGRRKIHAIPCPEF